MKNIDIKLHYYQKELVKKLVLSEDSLKFNQLQIEGLGSEHMNYHLKQLVGYGFVKKRDGRYLLTDEGKDYSNLLEDDVKTLEKQPKTSIIIYAVREKKGKTEYLLSKRLRQPYYGKVGRLSGKVKFGEKLKDAVSRELYEETGLKAENIELDNIYRKLRHKEDGTFVQDVFFYIFIVKDFSGDLIEKTEFQENFWLTKEEIEKRDDLFDDMSVDERFKPNDILKLEENIDVEKGY